MNEKFDIFIKISLKLAPKGPIDNNTALCLDKGLTSNMCQTIFWTNADRIHWRIYAEQGGDDYEYTGNYNTWRTKQNKIYPRAHSVGSTAVHWII